MLDVRALRSQFPALASDAAFFDGPGGSQVPQSVIDAVVGCLRDANANLGGAFATSQAADELMEKGRAAAADFTGGEADGIAFGANMTTLNFQLAHAVARTLSPGDEIVVTALDHDANVSPWLVVAGDHDLVVRTATLLRLPAVGRALARLAGRVTTADMRAMNAAVDLDHREVRVVAAAFLASLPPREAAAAHH